MKVTSPHALYAELGLSAAPSIVDVRPAEELHARPQMIPGARCGDPQRVQRWCDSLARNREVVVYGPRGKDAADGVAEELSALGHAAGVLEGGLEAWLAEGHATVRVRPELGVPGNSRWVTRERPKIDRLACPWLVRRFIDPDALFFYTPAHRVRSDALSLAAEPYDIADVVFSHRGANCSFDAFLAEFALHDPILDAVADIVRAADTGELANSPQAAGLVAISLGLSASIADDVLLLEQALPLYDALYAWCKTARHETHSWPKKKL